MLLRYFYDEKLAQASYMVGCQMTGEAVVIDPARNITPYLQEAEKEGMNIVATAETHIHADFVSGSLELAKRTGSKAYLSDEGDASWKYAFAKDIDSQLVKEGDTFKVGNVTLEVMHTPGHTPEHISFLLYDRNQTQPMGIFTGDFVFVGDIGRPDLLEEAAGVKGTTAIGAEQMFDSLNKFKALPDFVQVWPGHGAGSACGKALGAIPTSTVGYEKATNWALQMTDKDAFIKELTTDQPEPPNYFAMMKKVNKEGIEVTNTLPRPEVVGADRLDKLVNDTQVIDTRRGEDFAKGHVPGTINIPYNTKFVSWAGWLVNFDEDITLIASADDVEQVQIDLQSIGMDKLRYIVPVEELGQELLTETYTDVTAEQAIDSAEKGDVFVLDVRNATEWNASHYEKAERILLGKLARDHEGLPTDKTIAVHCASGVRSRMAASVLQSLGYKDIQNILGGYGAMKTVLNAEQIR
ncbi:MBL fold metallo-hydrolase [Exiguobacterium aurantiacum]|uniref:Probable polyketide biosynthesis zinc-dependent hydrolase BaeB n=1 Tax=Exiguobacterium aurantiacum TaxID=33987 RepID=A0A377FVI8_9BACL|nr:MBL fold metallo-hydrolase [Exiguobacterium aurantiacum]STO08852.1 Probable polyketide biosynthesis zinc-dependent hydrolase BaeB [Exiguobacterium aurantiacum]